METSPSTAHNVVSIDDYRPHIACFDPVENCYHVMPLDMLTDMANGLIDVDSGTVRAIAQALLELHE